MFDLLRRRAILAWTVAIVLLLGVFLFRSQDDLGRSARAVRDAEPGWLIAVALLAIASQAGFSHVLWLIVRRLHPGVRWGDAANAHMQRFAVGSLSPLPGPGVIALTRSLRGRGVSTQNGLLAVALEALVGHGSLVLYLAPVMAILAFDGKLSLVLVAATVVLAGIFVAIGVLIAVALRPGRLPGGLARRIPGRVEAYLAAARAHRVEWRDLVRPMLMALAINVTGAATLYAALAAVGAEPGIAMAAAAYGVATLFLLVAPFFAGIGIVEVTAVVMLRQFGVPADQALGATILYRVAALWLPLAVALLIPVATHSVFLGRIRRR